MVAPRKLIDLALLNGNRLTAEVLAQRSAGKSILR
jgi:hypothetical protein